MKAIINGKRYDTKTAEEVAFWSTGHNCTDFNYCEETLYKTKSGAWFLSGEGGALSSYSRSCGDGRGGGSSIQPMTADEALEWLESHSETEAIEQHFADQVTDA